MRAMLALLLLSSTAFAEPEVLQNAAPQPAQQSLPPAITRFLSMLDLDFAAIVDFSAGWYSDEKTQKAVDDPGHTGFNAQQIELALQAAVDRWFRVDLYLTVPNLGGLVVDEAYLSTTRLPGGFTLRAGIFRAGLGIQNRQHLHEQDFTRRPRIAETLLGENGLRAPGLELSWLVPRVPFPLVISFAALSPQAADANAPLQSFGGGARWDFAYVATARALFPLRGARSLEIGLNYAHGKTSQRATEGCLLPTALDSTCATAFDNWYDNLFGVDVKLKTRSLAWQTEWFMRQIPDLKILGQPHVQAEGGLYSQLVARLGSRWLFGLRGEALGVPRGDNLRTELAAAASITWQLSPMSRVRAYGEMRFPVGTPSPNPMFLSGIQPSDHVLGVLFLQMEVAIGAHGAHAF